MHAPETSSLPGQLGKDEVRSVYERIAPIYDLWTTLTETRAVVAVLRWQASATANPCWRWPSAPA